MRVVAPVTHVLTSGGGVGLVLAVQEVCPGLGEGGVGGDGGEGERRGGAGLGRVQDGEGVGGDEREGGQGGDEVLNGGGDAQLEVLCC